MNERFQLQFFVEDDDGYEDKVVEGYFSTVASAEDRANNIGSRWIFYPNVRIVDTDANEIVVEYYNQ